jgi:hydroxydechloroatrazine ethylaminohydrolase
MLERYGCRSLNWCEDIGFIGPDVWFAHGWEFTSEEIDILAKTNTGLSHCPAPVVLGHFNVIDIPRIMAKGVRLGLGVDGYASNDGGNMLELPRLTYQLQNLSSDKRNYHIPTAYECLKFATSGGAKLLGRDDIGSLEVGKAADMFMIDVNKLEYLGALHCPESFLARVGWSGPVSSTMVNGKIVFENGNLVGCEEAKEIEKASKCLSKVIYGSDIYKKHSNVLHEKHK